MSFPRLKSLLAARPSSSGAVLSRIMQAALPNRCVLCGNLSQRSVCGACDTTEHESSQLRCVCCAALLEPAAGPTPCCRACRAAPPDFDATVVCGDYAAPLDMLAQALKFSAQPGLAHWFARGLAERTLARAILPDLIIPVPLAAARLAERGYNQSWEIAKPLARRLRIPACRSFVRRQRNTVAQTDLGDVRQRLHNVHDAFTVQQAGLPRSLQTRALHVAVVDDVMTSGATLAEIARILKYAGVARVTNLVALRTPAPQTRLGLLPGRPVQAADHR